MSAAGAAEGQPEAAGELILTQVFRVGGKQEESVWREDRPAIGEERVQVGVKAPRFSGGAVAVGRRVERDRVVPAAPSALTRDVRPGVVDEPADGGVPETVCGRVAPRPGDGWPGRIDVRDRRACRSRGERREARVREEVQHPHRGSVVRSRRAPELDTFSKPRQHGRMLGKAADLPGIGRPKAHLQSLDRGGPAVAGLRQTRPRPPHVAIEAQICLSPALGRPPLAVGTAMWPVDHVRAEAFQTSAPAGIDELVTVHGGIITETATRWPSYRIRDERWGGTQKENASCADPSSRA